MLTCGLLFAGAVALRAEAPAAETVRVEDLTTADLSAGFAELESLGAFFGAFADRETNALARDRWRRLSVNYRETAERLRRLLQSGELVIGDLAEGQASLALADGPLVLDRDLDGRWPRAAFLGPLQESQPAEVKERLRDALLPVLLQVLAQRYPPQDWPWLADHLRAAGGLSALASDSGGRPLLARFFQAKDAYLWLSMQRIAQGDPLRRQALARRQVAAFEAIRGLRAEMTAAFGPGPAERLQQDWAAYVAQVDGFATTRGWLLLDPALRLTQLGAAAKEDAVDLAAARVVAEAPRSAVAAARTEKERVAQTSQAPAEGSGPLRSGTPLSEVAAQAQEELALEAVRAEVAALRARIGELDRAVAAGAAEAAGLEETLAGERARLAAVERQAAEQAALAATLSAKVAELSALEGRMAELESLLAQRGEAADAIQSPAATTASPPAATGGEETFSLSASGQRQLYIIAAIVVIFVMGLLLWLRGRQRGQAAKTSPVPLLLTSPAQDAAAVQQSPLIDIPEAPAEVPERKQAVAPKFSMPPKDARIRVSGTLPPTPESRAALKAGAVKARASRSATTFPEAGAQVAPEAAPQAAPRVVAKTAERAATLGNESAATAHPVVQALRKGNLPLFELLFGEMTGLRAPQLQNVAYGGQGEHLLIACRAVGVDKLLFGSIFLLTDSLRGGDADDDPARAAEVLQMYDRMPPETAQKVLAKWRGAWGGEVSRPEEASLG